MGRTLREIANGPPVAAARAPRPAFVWRWGRLWRLRFLAAEAERASGRGEGRAVARRP